MTLSSIIGFSTSLSKDVHHSAFSSIKERKEDVQLIECVLV